MNYLKYIPSELLFETYNKIDIPETLIEFEKDKFNVDILIKFVLPKDSTINAKFKTIKNTTTNKIVEMSLNDYYSLNDAYCVYINGFIYNILSFDGDILKCLFNEKYVEVETSQFNGIDIFFIKKSDYLEHLAFNKNNVLISVDGGIEYDFKKIVFNTNLIDRIFCKQKHQSISFYQNGINIVGVAYQIYVVHENVKKIQSEISINGYQILFNKITKVYPKGSL